MASRLPQALNTQHGHPPLLPIEYDNQISWKSAEAEVLGRGFIMVPSCSTKQLFNRATSDDGQRQRRLPVLNGVADLARLPQMHAPASSAEFIKQMDSCTCAA